MWLAWSSLPSTFNFKMPTALAPDESNLHEHCLQELPGVGKRTREVSYFHPIGLCNIPGKVIGHPCPRPASELPLWWAVMFLIHTFPSFWQTMKASNREKYAGEQREQGTGFQRRFSTVATDKRTVNKGNIRKRSRKDHPSQRPQSPV